MRCPECRSENASDLANCSSCGSNLLNPTVALSANFAETILQPGFDFGPRYRILGLAGAGGMGRVYKAWDKDLDRTVALKVLRPELAGNAASLQRFKRELSLASRVSHRNIIRIHDLGDVDGVKFISMAFVDGEDLGAALERQGRIPLDRALDIARQLCCALEAAHTEDVVHRDLKPSNVLLEPNGHVYVADFGLAKTLDEEAVRLSQAGTVLGTPRYMSPEQLQGLTADHRSDIYAFGLTFYEMLTGKSPFAGKSTLEVMYQRVHQTPSDPRTFNRDVPPWVAGIIAKCLERDPERRYHSASAILKDLDSAHAPGPAAARRRWMTISLSVAALLAAAAFAPMVWHELHDRGILGPDWFRMESIRQVTYNGRTKTAAISPDGRYLAFVVSDPGGFETLYVKQLEPASEQVKIPKRRIEYAGITFSPDSQSIYEVEKDDTLTGKLYRVPLVGDRPNTPIVVDIDGPVSFSPSGTQFAFVRYLPDQQKSVLELGSTSLTPSEPAPVISLHEMTILQRVAWAPKGDVIAAFLFSANGDGMLDLINVKGQESRRMLPAWRTIGQPAWTSNAETLIVPAVLRTEGDTRGQLREISLKDGSIHDVTKDIAGYTSATLTRDGQQLASVRLESKASVWISGPNDFKAGQSASAEVQEQPSLSWSDDSHIVLNLQRSGFPNLWRYDITGGSLATLTNEPYVEQDATYVSGRNLVVFSSNRSGEFHIWTFDAESNKYTQLTFGPGYDEAPSVSPDGKWVVYTSWTGNSPHLYKVSLSGGGAFQIGKRRARHADISPDGKFIACEIQDPGMFVAVIPFDGEGEPQAFRNAQIPVHWLRDGSGLSTVLTDARGVSNIWSIPTNGSPPQQLTRFDEQGIVAFAWSPRGDRLACIRTTSTGDAVILRRQR